jgi:hypothetical protein
MSTTAAIGDLTTLLAAHLDTALTGVNGARVTTLPPDKAQPAERQNRLNLFLTHVTTNAALSNLPMPGTHPGADGPAPLAITLHYLLTFIGEDDLDELAVVAQRMLGSVMRLLLDQPDIRRERIQALVPESFIDRQVDRVRLTSRPLTLEEISRLWPALQTPYRLTIGLEASCLLIERADDRPSPMPVLRRGKTDFGPVAVAGSPYPLIAEVRIGPPATPLPAARIGDTVTIVGQRLQAGPGREALLRVRDGSGALILDIPAAPGEAGTLTVQLQETYPGLPIPVWRAEALTMAVVIREPGKDDLESNEIVVGMAPRIIAIGPVVPGEEVPGGPGKVVDAHHPDTLDLSVEFAPPVFPLQAVDAWWGRQHLEQKTNVGGQPLGVLEFQVQRPDDVPHGVRSPATPVRLRIARVDSIPVRAMTGDEAGTSFELDPDSLVAIKWT